MDKVLIFDIGGVLVELGGMSRFVQWTGLDPDQVRHSWLASEAVRDFESGRISFHEFAPVVLEEFNIPLSIEHFHAEFISWIKNLFPETVTILNAVQERHVTGCLCNINPVHWPIIRDEHKLDRYFQHQFISHEIGMVKPDAEIFQHVTDSLGVSPDQITFFDDSRVNVEAAISAGWSAYLVQGTTQLRSKLIDLGIL